MKTFKVGILSVMVGVALLFGIQSTALGVPYMEVVIGDFIHAPIIVVDGSVNDLSNVTGAVAVSTSYQGWTINVVTGVSYNNLGSVSQPYIDLNTINVSSTGGGTIIVGVDVIGFTGPIAAGKTGPFFMEVGGTTSGKVDIYAMYDVNTLWNGANLGANQIGHLGQFSGGAFSASGYTSTFNNADPYALFLQANITHTGASSTSLDADIQGKVPEPISLILLGSGLAGAGLYRRLRKPKKA